MYKIYALEFPDVPNLLLGEIKRQLTYQKIILVDVREDYEVAISLIPSAITRDYFEDNIEDYRHHIIIVYCTIGYRPGLYTEELINQNFNAYNMAGGVLLWGYDFININGMLTRKVHVYGEQWNLLPQNYIAIY